MAALTRVEVPDIGDFSDVPVIEVLVAEGDTVEVDSPLVTLESEKATMEIPAPVAGVVQRLLVKLGDKVSEGTPIAEIATEDGAPAAAPDAGATKPEPDAPAVPEPTASAIAPADAADAAGIPAPRLPDDRGDTPATGGQVAYASPLARRVARELGVDLATIKGSGRNGRIVRADIEAAAAGTAPAAAPAGPATAPAPQIDFTRYGEVERVPLSRIQKISGPNLARNWVTIPHVTHHDEADITDLEAFRKQVNAEHPETKVTMVALLVKAVVACLKEFPDFNSSLEGEELVRKRYWNIGFAADTPHGLMVPVIKNADQRGLLEIAAELTRLSGVARDGTIGPADLSGSTFTISSLGGIGGTGFTPIINGPEVAILGVTRSAMKPVWDGSAFQPRLMLPLSLSYDHRVIDGAAAARFTAQLAKVLSDLRRVLL